MSSKVTPMFDATVIAGITLETIIEPQSKKGTNQIKAFFLPPCFISQKSV